MNPETEDKDPIARRAKLCQEISKLLGVSIVRILRITGADPTYLVELDSGKAELSDISRLIEQRAFRLAIASAADVFIPRFPPKLWERIARLLLSALTTSDGGDETGLVGSVEIPLKHYLAETEFISPDAKHPIEMCLHPAIIDGRVAVSAIEFQRYCFKSFAQSLTIKAITCRLTAMGAVNCRIPSGPLRKQCRWLLPSDNFSPSEYMDIREEE